MTMTRELSYRRSAIAGASPIGLMIALFDTLAGDLRRAANALRKNDIESRCRELNHAALVIGQLESWIDLKAAGESAQSLSRFYAYLRAKMLEASATKSAALLDAQIEMILHVRSAWQQLDTAPPETSDEHTQAQGNQVSASYLPVSGEAVERIPFSQSA
jgi:flagellar protein FliS